jgi:hypothetical protein
MAPRWVESAFKHNVSQADQIWAMLHPTYQADLAGESLDDGTVRLIIGHPHAQTDREIELLVNVYDDGREARVFHAMELGPKFRRYREENPNG